MTIAGLRDGVPVEIDRDTAREVAQRELSHPMYGDAEPSLLTRALRWTFDQLGDLLDAIGAIAPGGVGGLVILLLVIVAIAVLIRLRAGPLTRSRRRRRPMLHDESVTADAYRSAAESAHARGDLAAAVTDRFRAIARELEQRGVLDAQSGRTADEVATQAGQLLPGCASGLRAAARSFDDVYYGGRAASEYEYQVMTTVDDGIGDAVRGRRRAHAGS